MLSFTQMGSDREEEMDELRYLYKLWMKKQGKPIPSGREYARIRNLPEATEQRLKKKFSRKNSTELKQHSKKFKGAVIEPPCITTCPRHTSRPTIIEQNKMIESEFDKKSEGVGIWPQTSVSAISAPQLLMETVADCVAENRAEQQKYKTDSERASSKDSTTEGTILKETTQPRIINKIAGEGEESDNYRALILRKCLEYHETFLWMRKRFTTEASFMDDALEKEDESRCRNRRTERKFVKFDYHSSVLSIESSGRALKHGQIHNQDHRKLHQQIKPHCVGWNGPKVVAQTLTLHWPSINSLSTEHKGIGPVFFDGQSENRKVAIANKDSDIKGAALQSQNKSFQNREVNNLNKKHSSKEVARMETLNRIFPPLYVPTATITRKGEKQRWQAEDYCWQPDDLSGSSKKAEFQPEDSGDGLLVLTMTMRGLKNRERDRRWEPEDQRRYSKKMRRNDSLRESTCYLKLSFSRHNGLVLDRCWSSYKGPPQVTSEVSTLGLMRGYCGRKILKQLEKFAARWSGWTIRTEEKVTVDNLRVSMWTLEWDTKLGIHKTALQGVQEFGNQFDLGGTSNFRRIYLRWVVNNDLTLSHSRKGDIALHTNGFQRSGRLPSNWSEPAQLIWYAFHAQIQVAGLCINWYLGTVLAPLLSAVGNGDKEVPFAYRKLFCYDRSTIRDNELGDNQGEQIPIFRPCLLKAFQPWLPIYFQDLISWASLREHEVLAVGLMLEESFEGVCEAISIFLTGVLKHARKDMNLAITLVYNVLFVRIDQGVRIDKRTVANILCIQIQHNKNIQLLHLMRGSFCLCLSPSWRDRQEWNTDHSLEDKAVSPPGGIDIHVRASDGPQYEEGAQDVESLCEKEKGEGEKRSCHLGWVVTAVW